MRNIQESPADLGGWAAASAPGDATGPVIALATNMPTWSTRLIGRDGDLARLRGLVTEAGHRLVVITGPGGIGKTRLAAQVASEVEAQFRHGARFLSFASVPEDADLDAVFIRRLGLRDEQDRSYRDSLRRYLEDREVLLVVDNVEHLLPRIAGLLRFIEDSCPSVAMLVTSRSTLGIYAEVVHRVYPLRHRTAGSLLPGMNPASSLLSDAVQLFGERARALAPAFAIDGDNAATVAAICDHLGCLPLAIELTAPRMATHTPAALLAEMEEGIALAVRGGMPPSAPAVSMQDTIQLSYDQLTADEQRVFRALCAMCGYWSFDDVLPILPPGLDELDAITHLDTLVTRSMVASPIGTADDVRFTVNPVLRHFGRGLLAALGEREAVADRHADRMLVLAEEAEPELTGPDQRLWLARLETLHEDLRDAHAHLLAHGRPVEALRLGAALWRYAYTRGHYREGREMIERALAGVSGSDALRSRALNGAGLLANMLRDAAGARDAHRRALELADRHGLDREIAIGRIGLADVDASFDNDNAGALRHLEHAADAYGRLNDARGIASVLTNQGNIQWVLGERDRAFATHEEARVLYMQVSDTRGIAWSDTNTGRIAAEQRRFGEAVPRLLAALEGYVQIGDAYGLTEVLEALAGVAAGTGDLELASMLAGAATTMRAAVGAPLKSPDLELFQSTLAAARRSPRYDDAFARGARLRPEEAIALARAVPVPEPLPVPDANAQALARQRYGITKREYQVLQLLTEGLTDPQIAERLDLSVRTAQTYTSALIRKLDVTSRVQAVRAAHQAGLVPQRPPTSR